MAPPSRSEALFPVMTPLVIQIFAPSSSSALVAEPYIALPDSALLFRMLALKSVSTEAFSTYKTDNATTSATSHALHSESNYDILTSKAQPNDTGAVLIGADSVIKTDNLTMSGYEISASSAKLTAKNISAGIRYSLP